jgi:hypothetical protein
MLVAPDEKLEDPCMKKVEGLIPESIYTALHARMSAEKETADHILSAALAQYLDRPLHTLFSVSTSTAIVEGLSREHSASHAFWSTETSEWARLSISMEKWSSWMALPTR